MLKNSILNNAQTNRVITHEQNTFNKKMRTYLNKEVHIKIENDDAPINYILKEIGKDYIVVLFAQMERTIQTQRIVYLQAETSVPVSSSPI